MTRDACVLDTHAWARAVATEGRLPSRARRTLRRASVRHVPAMCMWEMALLHARGRVAFHEPDLRIEDWLRTATADPFRVVALTPAIAVAAAALEHEGFHRDPADRLVYATARVLDLPLITRDQAIHRFEAGLPKRTRRLAVWD